MEIKQFDRHICLYFKDGSLVPGWIWAIQKSKLAVVPMEGREVYLPANRVLYHWRPEQNLNKVKAPEYLSQLMTQAQHFADTALDLAIIHELADPDHVYEIDQMVNDFLDDPEDPIQAVALAMVLYQPDQPWFRRNKPSGYMARSQAEIQAYKEKHDKEAAQKRWQVQASMWINELAVQTWPKTGLNDPEKAQFVAQVRSMLVEGKTSPHWALLAGAFGFQSGLGDREACRLRELLFRAGNPISHCGLLLAQAGVVEGFTPEEVEEADRLEAVPILPEGVDWSQTPTFTVDAEKTLDYDDAFSFLNREGEKLRVAVQIANVGTWVQPGGPLFKLARNRISSVYTLKQTYPMFPFNLSDHHFSLKEGEPRHTLAFIFSLSEGGDAELERIEQGTVVVDRNMTYEQVDQLIADGHHQWEQLFRCCQALKAKRIEAGAADISRKDLEFDISDPSHIRLTLRDRDSMANTVVQEMAILVNREVGRYFCENGLAGLFRTQLPENREENERFVPVKLTTKPGGHLGLGLEFYMQATSPIRRFPDLLAQLQLLAHLRKEKPPFSNKALQSMAPTIENSQKNYATVEDAIRTHWKYKYLDQNRGQCFPARIKRPPKRGKCETIIIPLQMKLQLPFSGKLDEGQDIYFHVEQVDTLRHKIEGKIFTNLPPDAIVHQIQDQSTTWSPMG